ncbi:MAG TPA: hypothetical protein VGH33_24190, partial [Isosphaeraceae bacterium]
QKQAADVMTEALMKEGVMLTHILGPQTKHQYEKNSKEEVDRRMTRLAVDGRDRAPDEVHFVTYSLRYNRMHWLAIDGMAEHWSPARVDARVEEDGVEIETKNVTDLTLDFPSGSAHFRPDRKAEVVTVTIDDDELDGPPQSSDRSWRMHLTKRDGTWREAETRESGLAKRHGLQGPIDDAFMDAFVIVRPTGKARSGKFAAWQKAEMDRAIEHWRRHFRGEPLVKDDTAITDADIASMNLILWGDPESNAVLKRIADRLPFHWNADTIVFGQQTFSAEDHAPIAIYPNPLNPNRYVVLNSGFTFRDYDYLNNARQVPKLPDWAVIDLKTPPNSRYPGKVVAADFFGERWEIKPPHEKSGQ